MKLKPETKYALIIGAVLGVVITLLLFSAFARFVVALIFVAFVLVVFYGLAHLLWPDFMRKVSGDDDDGGPHAQ